MIATIICNDGMYWKTANRLGITTTDPMSIPNPIMRVIENSMRNKNNPAIIILSPITPSVSSPSPKISSPIGSSRPGQSTPTPPMICSCVRRM